MHTALEQMVQPLNMALNKERVVLRFKQLALG